MNMPALQVVCFQLVQSVMFSASTKHLIHSFSQALYPNMMACSAGIAIVASIANFGLSGVRQAGRESFTVTLPWRMIPCVVHKNVFVKTP